jgi:hypothetical protein
VLTAITVELSYALTAVSHLLDVPTPVDTQVPDAWSIAVPVPSLCTRRNIDVSFDD